MTPETGEQTTSPAAALSANVDLPRALELRLKTPTPGRVSFGIALSGGGSKSAAFATGVLTSLAEMGLLDNADYISSVSGGGYAAYYYFTHRIFPLTRPRPARGSPSTIDLYRDCPEIPTHHESHSNSKLKEEIRIAGGCNPYQVHRASANDKIKHQAFLRCQQDIFSPGKCTTATTEQERNIPFAAIALSAPAVAANLFANTLFDSGIRISPSARLYRDGIGMAFGTTLVEPEILVSIDEKRHYIVRPEQLELPRRHWRLGR